MSVNQFQWPIRVYYEDTDAGGVVFYANYLRFMERARSEWLRALGFEQDELIDRDGVIFVVRHLELDFRRPARFNDLLRVSVEVVHRGRASLGFRQEVRRDADDALLCSGAIKVACLDATAFRPRTLPPRLLTEIADVV